MLLELYVKLLDTTPPLPSQNQVDNGFGFVIAAYAAVWILIFGYIYSLNRRQAKLRRDVEILKEEEAERKEQLRLAQTNQKPPAVSK